MFMNYGGWSLQSRIGGWTSFERSSTPKQMSGSSSRYRTYRMIGRAGDKPRVWSRWGLDWTHSFPSVTASLTEIDRPCLIDGEAVCQFEDGHSDFHALASDNGCAKAVLWAFDLLMLDGDDLRALPLEVRREKLLRLL